MLASVVTGIVIFATRFPRLVITAGLVAMVAAGTYAATHFAIDTNINKLISPDLDWRQREAAFEQEFPGHFGTTLIVIEAPTPEFAAAASAALVQRLRTEPQLFRAIDDLAGSEFFTHNGLLFRQTKEVAQLTQGLSQAGSLVDALVSDPSLRGLTRALSLGLLGIQYKQATLDDYTRPLSMASDSLDAVLAGRPATFSWQDMLAGKPSAPADRRRFVEVHPVLDYSALEPGRKSSEAIRQAVADLNLAEHYQARVRLTGPVPMGDEEFATVQQGALVNTAGTVVIVLVILWLALKSARIIAAVFVNLFAGLAITAALGLMMVGALNMISVAFAVLFVGLGVDFGIQFSVRYRAERHETPELKEAIALAARRAGVPLTLAAAAVAAGFLSFLPTSYRGVSELGQIAGVGMLIAYLTSITLLPALLKVFNPPGEPEEVGYRFLAPLDRALQRYRIPVVLGTLGIALLGAPLLYWLTFDFDPIHLRSPKAESISTLLDLKGEARTGINSINVVTPNLEEARKVAAKLRTLPEVANITTLDNFVPPEQPQKLALIRDFASKLGPILDKQPGPAPSDADNVAALKASSDRLKQLAGDAKGTGADAARRLSADLARLADADKAMREKAQAVFVEPLQIALAQLRDFTKAGEITVDKLPPDFKRFWLAADGKTRVEVTPSGDANNTEVLRGFARAVLTAFPQAVGGPVSILESGHTVVTAFIQAGGYALLSIAILLWIVLRRFGDVLLTLVPLILAGMVTLEICVLIGMPLNFANIIALPLLLGVGVAFKIYYIMAWRAGQTDLLQSSLTRAVFWSALTTATAFGSLWLSQHPGTSSMGKLLALSLVCTLFAAVLFQPALMGAPRERDTDA